MAQGDDIRRIEVIDDVMADALRRLSPGDRVRLGLAGYAFARRMAEAGVRHVHPDWPDACVEEEVRRRLSGESR